ncbi:MAG: UDP-N-acetylglucosamine 2-epimerase, partial [Desulfobacteria bacterium]
LRDETEWVELVGFGFNMLVGSNKERIIETVGRMKNVVVTDEDGMYGAGKAADCIVSALLGQLTHAKAQRR